MHFNGLNRQFNDFLMKSYILFTWKAAELAAKKSRVKQSLIKRARSVAIFSLKLKERRARDAEKHAIDLAEQEKVKFNVYCYYLIDFHSIEINHFNLLTSIIIFSMMFSGYESAAYWW